jgi:hypothetical protein
VVTVEDEEGSTSVPPPVTTLNVWPSTWRPRAPKPVTMSGLVGEKQPNQ